MSSSWRALVSEEHDDLIPVTLRGLTEQREEQARVAREADRKRREEAPDGTD